MCGIFCIFAEREPLSMKKLMHKCYKFRLNLWKRGPDHWGAEEAFQENQAFVFAAGVLWLQGQELIKQPIQNDDYVFVYNGDIFDSETEEERRVSGDTNLFRQFVDNSAKLYEVNGPFAFIYLDKEKSLLYFARDKFGRKSLLIGKSSGEIVLTSVASKRAGFQCIEVPPIGLYCLNIKNMELNIYLWQKPCETTIDRIKDFMKINVNYHITDISLSPSKLFLEPSDDVKNIISSLKEPLIDYKIDNFNENNAKELLKLLDNSVRKRLINIPKICHDCFLTSTECSHCRVGILFSGGLDCAVLALLADKYIETTIPIDLFNVSFKSDAEDRQTGQITVAELRKLRPERTWNFVEINVEQKELEEKRRICIAELIYPLDTILDESLGCALWFAAQGQADTYRSPCRIALSGIGADELLGGYTSHRTALKRFGWRGLHQALESSWEKLPYRNLGRDDRVVSDNGTQLRIPYLDEDVVNFLRSLNCWEKTIPVDNLPNVGCKILLRQVAFNLGLVQAAGFKKKAFQFGCRIANSKEKGHKRSPRLSK